MEGCTSPEMLRIGAVVLAGGQGKRMNSHVQKQYMMLEGRPLISYALEAFEQSPVDKIVLVVGPGEEEHVRREILKPLGLKTVSYTHLICLLGTGGMMPLPYRWLTAMMARCDGSSLLIDCGEGTQVALKEKGWSPKPIDVICFTHYHADHISGLPGLLLTMGNAEDVYKRQVPLGKL